MKRKNGARKSIISYIMAFILMLSIMGISFLSLGKYSMLSVHAVMYTCDRIGYYDSIRAELKQEAYYKGIPYGITQKCLKSVFKSAQIRTDIEDVLSAQVKGDTYDVQTENISNKIIENVEKNLGTINDSQMESLQKYIADIGEMYQKKMVIPSSEYIAGMINTATKFALIGIPVCVLIAILCIFYLVSTRKFTYHGLRYVVYGILGAGITLLTVFAAMISNGFIYKFNISDVYMRKFFTFLIGHEMLIQVFAGIGLLLCGVVMAYVTFRQKCKELQ